MCLLSNPLLYLILGVVGISEIIIRPGLINVDFADVRTIMGNAGTALMGIGRYILCVIVICYGFCVCHINTLTSSPLSPAVVPRRGPSSLICFVSPSPTYTIWSLFSSICTGARGAHELLRPLRQQSVLLCWTFPLNEPAAWCSTSWVAKISLYRRYKIDVFLIEKSWCKCIFSAFLTVEDSLAEGWLDIVSNRFSIIYLSFVTFTD